TVPKVRPDIGEAVIIPEVVERESLIAETLTTLPVDRTEVELPQEGAIEKIEIQDEISQVSGSIPEASVELPMSIPLEIAQSTTEDVHTSTVEEALDEETFEKVYMEAVQNLPEPTQTELTRWPEFDDLASPEPTRPADLEVTATTTATFPLGSAGHDVVQSSPEESQSFEEIVETLPDGTVVKTRKTIAETMQSVSCTNWQEGVDAAVDSGMYAVEEPEERTEVRKPVEEIEETLPDGTVITRLVTTKHIVDRIIEQAVTDETVAEELRPPEPIVARTEEYERPQTLTDKVELSTVTDILEPSWREDNQVVDLEHEAEKTAARKVSQTEKREDQEQRKISHVRNDRVEKVDEQSEEKRYEQRQAKEEAEENEVTKVNTQYNEEYQEEINQMNQQEIMKRDIALVETTSVEWEEIDGGIIERIQPDDEVKKTKNTVEETERKKEEAGGKDTKQRKQERERYKRYAPDDERQTKEDRSDVDGEKARVNTEEEGESQAEAGVEAEAEPESEVETETAR
ncbi:uncharacterized protein DEA37_0002083, partial [Paragonimus westermani]